MKWLIPAKTFLLGEYVALAGGPAILLTTVPCFELRLIKEKDLKGIHKDSPASRWWALHGALEMGLDWQDPYHGKGGMGASSAQFIGAYLASLASSCEMTEMLQAYQESAYGGQGARPSGYDVIAQSLSGCVYIDRQRGQYATFAWPFHDIGFLLLHTGKKLATHGHLQSMSHLGDMEPLVRIVSKARKAFESRDSGALVDAVNAYHQRLATLNLVSENSLKHIAEFKRNGDVLAIKGCGAMGADVLLLLVPSEKLTTLRQAFLDLGWDVVARSTDLYGGPGQNRILF